MELSELQSYIPDPQKLITKVISQKPISEETIKIFKNQWDPALHDVMDPTKRQDKQIETDQGGGYANVTRIAVPMQKQIVDIAAAFLCGNPITLNALPEGAIETDLIAVLKKSWKLNKLDYESKKMAALMMAETEVAELWYAEQAPKGYWRGTPNDKEKVKLRLRVKVLASSYGDELYPVFNSFGDMIAFGRGYSITEGEKITQYFDLYTDTFIYKHVKGNSGWEQKKEKNLFEKIPVIYYNQPQVEWHDVQPIIDRFETLISNHSDTNDYFGSPMVFVQGELDGFAKKGEQGKVLVGKAGATAQYLAWDQSPESVKLEFNNLRSLMYDMTSTPDISIEQMKSLGTYSGIALKMLFLSAHLKASKKEEIFGKGVQRRINFLKYALSQYVNTDLDQAVSMDIEPKFEYYLPKDLVEIITMLSTATAGQAVLSQATALSLNPLVMDATKELKTVQQEGLNQQQNQPL